MKLDGIPFSGAHIIRDVCGNYAVQVNIDWTEAGKPRYLEGDPQTHYTVGGWADRRDAQLALDFLLCDENAKPTSAEVIREGDSGKRLRELAKWLERNEKRRARAKAKKALAGGG